MTNTTAPMPVDFGVALEGQQITTLVQFVAATRGVLYWEAPGEAPVFGLKADDNVIVVGARYSRSINPTTRRTHVYLTSQGQVAEEDLAAIRDLLCNARKEAKTRGWAYIWEQIGVSDTT